MFNFIENGNAIIEPLSSPPTERPKIQNAAILKPHTQVVHGSIAIAMMDTEKWLAAFNEIANV